MYPWSVTPKLHKNMGYINREMEKTLLEAWQYFSVLTVTGPRQSGKSTLLKHLFPDAVAFSLKDIQVRDFALNDPVAFLGQTDHPLFIDEIQKVPALIEYIQGIVDNHPERKFLLSGSSQFEVMKGVSESLAGRSGVYELMPMSLSETREITAIEIKSSQTYSPSFEDSLKKLSGWIHTPIRRKSVVYSGEFENTAGDIEVVNYRHLNL